MLPDLSAPRKSAPVATRYRNFAEQLIDCGEDRTPRAVLVGMLMEA
jgi:hypothetical protein